MSRVVSETTDEPVETELSASVAEYMLAMHKRLTAYQYRTPVVELDEPQETQPSVVGGGVARVVSETSDEAVDTELAAPAAEYMLAMQERLTAYQDITPVVELYKPQGNPAIYGRWGHGQGS
ncbi:hypothetical protein SARC_00324 [Sphaeroforma arctica JP610]|uniref:Uncharacterized protein n=1 Tax=Sphaeroforma arctica JP610 TaxID=667725 RepID=A0A0L0GFE4_9EUKA|nr:hypothetical protein SARC_00324 [Sphaeroforma arctica JP610]KNC87559.1 hypothetical protein SARC_00324 [Sphaeroforma arctica JP610]|eukprot:XP_014161461.1 hypothetical protein SARC_00324 [Sphaeroforma arctica JP610]